MGQTSMCSILGTLISVPCIWFFGGHVSQGLCPYVPLFLSTSTCRLPEIDSVDSFFGIYWDWGSCCTRPQGHSPGQRRRRRLRYSDGLCVQTGCQRQRRLLPPDKVKTRDARNRPATLTSLIGIRDGVTGRFRADVAPTSRRCQSGQWLHAGEVGGVWEACAAAMASSHLCSGALPPAR
jgi:hypothetical protein